MTRFGYHGRILHVDLASRTSRVEERDDEFWRVYGGGGLLATALLLRDTPPGIDAFDPRNPLVVASSVMAGHPYVGLARFTVSAKSPLSGGIGEARSEGPFGIRLKGSGVDAVVLHGRSPKPVAVVVEAGSASFLDASSLWGTTVPEATERLRTMLGDVGVAAIGPAGENLVRFASIVSECHHQAARTGMGAVMGSKQVKALVVAGDHRPPVADPGRCESVTARYAARMRGNPLTKWQLDPPGFAAWVHTHGTDAALCTRNYRDSVFGHAEAYTPERFMARYLGVAPCPGCPNDCIKVFGGGAAGDAGSGGIHQEITGAFGSNLGLGDLDAVFAANARCNELGLDPDSLGFTLSMAMECVEEGELDEGRVGLPLRFGNAGAALAMLERVAFREGFGDVLAEGALRAARVVGGRASRWAMQVKGVEMVPFEPRTQGNLALGYATAPVGPRYEVCEHDWDYDTEVGWPHTMEGSRTLGVLRRLPMERVSVDKVRNFKALNTVWSAADTLGVCLFAAAPTRALRLEEMAELLGAVTGWETSSWELMRFGERRNHLMRVYNLREGLGADDDTLPDRFFDDPVPDGRWAGLRLDRDAFLASVRAWYRMTGWDEAGVPLPETLVDHHLGWVLEPHGAP